MRAARARRRQAGFTLVETVLAMSLTGIVAAVVAVFVVRPVQAYFDTLARAELSNAADNALRLVAREVRAALPNSLRVTNAGQTLEFIPASAGGRYRSSGDGSAGNDPLAFGEIDIRFEVLGPMVGASAGQWLVVNNLGADGVYPSSNAYAAENTAGSNRRRVSAVDAGARRIDLSSSAALATDNFVAPHRFHLVEQPVSYHCSPSATPGLGTLSRIRDYGFQAPQPAPPTSGVSALLARGVTACSFGYEATAVAQRHGLLSLRLTLSASTPSGSESVTLFHAVHVDNLP